MRNTGVKYEGPAFSNIFRETVAVSFIFKTCNGSFY